MRVQFCHIFTDFFLTDFLNLAMLVGLKCYHCDFDQPSPFVTKMLLEYSYAHSFTYCPELPFPVHYKPKLVVYSVPTIHYSIYSVYIYTIYIQQRPSGLQNLNCLLSGPLRKIFSQPSK